MMLWGGPLDGYYVEKEFGVVAWSFPWHPKFPDVIYIAGEDLLGNEVYVYVGPDPTDPRSHNG